MQTTSCEHMYAIDCLPKTTDSNKRSQPRKLGSHTILEEPRLWGISWPALASVSWAEGGLSEGSIFTIVWAHMCHIYWHPCQFGHCKATYLSANNTSVSHLLWYPTKNAWNGFETFCHHGLSRLSILLQERLSHSVISTAVPIGLLYCLDPETDILYTYGGGLILWAVSQVDVSFLDTEISQESAYPSIVFLVLFILVLPLHLSYVGIKYEMVNVCHIHSSALTCDNTRFYWRIHLNRMLVHTASW